jgi:hypothetical protein
MPPSNEYLIMKMNACCQVTAIGLNMLDRAALRRWPPEKIGRDRPNRLWRGRDGYRSLT